MVIRMADFSQRALTEAVAAELRAARAAARITFDQLADASGVSKSTLLRLFDGKRDLSITVLVKLAGPLDVIPADLVARAEARMERNVGRASDSDLIDELPVLAPDEVAKKDVGLAAEDGRDEGVEQTDDDAEDASR